MMLLALVALLAAPQSSEEQMKRDYEMLASVNSEAITVPVVQCAAARIKAYRPSFEDMGDLKKAAELTGQSFEECGAEAQSKRLQQAITAKFPQTATEEAERVAKVAFGLPYVIALYEASELLKATPPSPEQKPMQIPLPCRPDLTRTPGHPCYEKPKN